MSARQFVQVFSQPGFFRKAAGSSHLPSPKMLSTPASCRLAVCTEATHHAGTLVKVCGITHTEDAELAVAAGAAFLGVIQCPRFRRFVDLKTTKQIAAIAHRAGIPIVGVFVDEDAEAIALRSSQADLDLVQLHGDTARSALPGLPRQLQVVYVAHAAEDGSLQTALPDSKGTGNIIDLQR